VEFGWLPSRLLGNELDNPSQERVHKIIAAIGSEVIKVIHFFHNNPSLLGGGKRKKNN